jgi:undecaprenyl-diphosphatase
MKAEKESRIGRHKTVILLMFLALFVFLFMLYSVVTQTFFYDVDVWVSAHSTFMHQHLLNKAVIFITHLNGVVGSSILSLVLLAYLAYKKWNKDLRFYLFSFLGASLLFTGIKNVVERARPQSELIDVVNYSFPSGHATMAMTIAIAIYFIFVSKITSDKGRSLLLWATIAWPLLIAFTRVYLNVHWLSDTLAGLSLGFFWVALLYLILIKKQA